MNFTKPEDAIGWIVTEGELSYFFIFCVTKKLDYVKHYNPNKNFSTNTKIRQYIFAASNSVKIPPIH